jgi:hypothetical protein
MRSVAASRSVADHRGRCIGTSTSVAPRVLRLSGARDLRQVRGEKASILIRNTYLLSSSQAFATSV